jgi:hypothetical protein
MIGLLGRVIGLWWFVKCSVGARWCSTAGQSRSDSCSRGARDFGEQLGEHLVEQL